MTAYLAYLAGDVFGLSGILAIFVCAVAISHYALHNISGSGRGCISPAWRHSRAEPQSNRHGPFSSRCTEQFHRGESRGDAVSPLLACPAAESRTTTIYAFHTLSYISEGIIFVYCGLDALDPLKWQVGRRDGARRLWQAEAGEEAQGFGEQRLHPFL